MIMLDTGYFSVRNTMSRMTLWEEGVYFLVHSLQVNPSLREVGAGTQGRNLEQRSCRSVAY